MRIKDIISQILSIFDTDDSISSKATSGLAYMGSRQIILQILLLVKILIVANILGPYPMGVFAIILLLVLLLEQFSQIGIESALIQKQEGNDHYNVAWTVRFWRGVILFCILFIFQNQILSLLDIEEFRLIYIIISSTLLFEAVINIGTVEFLKDFNYEKEFKFKAIPDMTNIGITIILALILSNIWALVMGLMSERLIRLILSYKLHSYRPRMEFDWNKFSNLFGYGKWVFVLGIIQWMVSQGVEFTVGVIFSTTVLAIYQLGYKLAIMPVQSFTETIVPVSLPTFAKLQEDTGRSLKTFQYLIFAQLLLFSLYLSVFFPFVDDFVNLLLGEEWISMIEILRILLFLGIAKIFVSTIEPIFLANAEQQELVPWRIFSTVCFIIGIMPISYYFGLVGVVIWLIAFHVILLIGYFSKTDTMLDLDFKYLGSNMTSLVIISSLTILILSIIEFYLPIFSIITLFLYLISGLFIFVGLVWFDYQLFDRQYLRDMITLLNNQLVNNNQSERS